MIYKKLNFRAKNELFWMKHIFRSKIQNLFIRVLPMLTWPKLRNPVMKCLLSHFSWHPHKCRPIVVKWGAVLCVNTVSKLSVISCLFNYNNNFTAPEQTNSHTSRLNIKFYFVTMLHEFLKIPVIKKLQTFIWFLQGTDSFDLIAFNM